MNIKERLDSIKEGGPNHSKLFLKLREGRAYTLRELANTLQLPADKAEAYLTLLLDDHILQTRTNRQRIYYYLADKSAFEVINSWNPDQKNTLPKGMKYSRHCYRHLAGYAGVQLTEALAKKDLILPDNMEYLVTEKGWQWFSKLGIQHDSSYLKGGKLTKQCLDFSERKSHLGGRLGDVLLEKMLLKNWLKQAPDSREILITPLGAQTFKKELNLTLEETTATP